MPVNQSSGPNAIIPATNAVAITESDTDYFKPTRALYIGTGGSLVITTVEGDDVTFANVPNGIFPIQAIRLKAASTVADVVALY